MEEKIEQVLRLLAMDIREYMSQEKWVEEAKRALYPIIFSNQVEPPVMPMDDTIKMLYEKLRAQISIYAGKKDGGLATLQDLYGALNDGETIICECCGQRITGKGGHLTGCDIVKKYFKVFGHSA